MACVTSECTDLFNSLISRILFINKGARPRNWQKPGDW